MSLSSSISLQDDGIFNSGHPSRRIYVIYFITGNPGLITYYDTFLTHLYGLLTDSKASTTGLRVEFQVHGRSLSGFEVPTQYLLDARTDKVRAGENHPPYSLQEQILHSKRHLEALVCQVQGNCHERDGDHLTPGSKNDVRVILVGHSVGTYIGLEVMRRLAEDIRSESSIEQGLQSPSKSSTPPRVAGAVLLFATITHLARSPRGLLMAPFALLPHFALVISLITRSLLFFIPASILESLIQIVLKFPKDAAHVTTGFLKSAGGVRQALRMAADEFREIKEIDGRWLGEELDEIDRATGSARDKGRDMPRPMLKILWGANDYWVDNKLRDEFIRTRAPTSELRGRNEDENAEARKAEADGEAVTASHAAKTTSASVGSARRRPVRHESEENVVMHVDRSEDWPHDFCIHHSIPLARRTADYIRDIVEQDSMHDAI